MLMPFWKRLVLISTSAGAGFALVLTLVFALSAWYDSRPKTWNTSAMKASFDHIGTNVDGNQLLFCYILENTTDVDYRLLDNSGISIMSRYKDKSLSGPSDLHTAYYPVFVPAKERVSLCIYSLHIYTPDDKIKVRSGVEFDKLKGKARVEALHDYHKMLAAFVREEVPNLDGFVLFDTTNHYRIDFPRGW